MSLEDQRAIVGACLLLGGLALAPMVVALSKFWIPGRNNFFARWGFTHFTLVVIVYLCSGLLVSLAWNATIGDELGFAGIMLKAGLIFLAPAALIIKLALDLDPDKLKSLGFTWPGSVRAVLFGLVTYVLLIPALLGASLLWPWIFESLGGVPETQAVIQQFIDLDPAQLAVPVLFAVLIQPFFEELIFRGFLQPLLVQNFREFWGVILTSLLFALVHPLAVFLPVFALSLVLGGVMQRTQRFASCWAVHAVHNGLMLLLVLGSPEAREFMDATGLTQ
ncbi:MAG: membrane protease YdiL (CAAX protease family) [Planctomycetota bacterium]|jgi:membrane protease YdiL (CAAX protease family)